MKIHLLKLAAIKLALLLTVSAAAQNQGNYYRQCSSISAANSGDWKPIDRLPKQFRDGRAVELMETFGIAPWYGLFKWTNKVVAASSICDTKGHCKEMPAEEITVDYGWHSASNGIDEDNCLFWREYNGSDHYVDPTGGAQNGIAYWCRAAGEKYNPKTNTCGGRR